MYIFVIPFLFDKWNNIKKGVRELIIFLLFSLWHGYIIQALKSSQESVFVLIVSAVGLLIVDLYLFFNYYDKNKDK